VLSPLGSFSYPARLGTRVVEDRRLGRSARSSARRDGVSLCGRRAGIARFPDGSASPRRTISDQRSPLSRQAAGKSPFSPLPRGGGTSCPTRGRTIVSSALLNTCLTQERGETRKSSLGPVTLVALSGFLESERQLLALAVIRDCLINCSRKGRKACVRSLLACSRLPDAAAMAEFQGERDRCAIGPSK